MNKEEKMKILEKEVKKCQRCSLHETRNNPVPGEGFLDAKIMFIGEGPGYWEDKEGKPFVGKAGRVLDELLGSAGLSREKIYITNVLKCRPPENRDPTGEEVKACTSYLDRQIEIIQPKIIAALGRFATSYIFGKFGLEERKISAVHGEVFKVSTVAGQIKIIPLLHPAVATYNPGRIEELKRDFEKLKEI